MKASAFAVSPAVRSFALQRESKGAEPRKRAAKILEREDPLIERDAGTATNDSEAATSLITDAPMPPATSFDGLANYDNIDLYELLILPPDPIGDVGPSHYVQAVNSALRIFDKSGAPLTQAFRISDLFAPLGTLCSTRNDGDPVVLYDPLADRWLISQFCLAFPPFRQMIAVSRTGDPLGEYFAYEFVMPNVRLNDFGKLGVWPDGYYMSTEEYHGSDYYGSGAFAFDRAAMLAGDPSAGYVYISLPYDHPERVGGFLPADLDGLAPPPAGAPNIFTGYTANEYGDAQDAIRLFEFRPDFAHPPNSTFTERPESPLAVSAFDPTSPSGRADIAQPSPGERLDSNSDRLSYRTAYRNFGTHESIVFNQTVRLSPAAGPYRAGIRLYELRRTPGLGFAVHEQLTLGDQGSSRWIGAAAQDNHGNLAVSYNFVSDEKVPYVMYSGRLASDGPGTMRREGTLVAGTGVQKAFGFRWGDYSGLSVDPADDCTFWATGEYYTLESQTFSDFTWLTRIGKFKYPECTPAPRSSIAGAITDAVTGQPIARAAVGAGAYSRVSSAGGGYGPMNVTPGTYTVRATANGYREQAATVTAAAGESVTRDFALEPIPVVVGSEPSFVSESCAITGSAEPGEAVSVSIPLRNTGMAAANSVTVRLIRSGGVIEPGPPQDYGSLPAGGPAVARTFGFRVSPNVACGGPITLTFEVMAASQNIGTVSIPLRAGSPRYALREDFDAVAPPALPAGWTTATTGAQQVWRSTAVRSSSLPNALFSPDPNQVGLNELVSPEFPITTNSAKLTFRNWYELETTFLRNRLYDGSVLEISLDGGPWRDILEAGGAFESGGYDGRIDACCQNPLAGRMGWSGRSGVNQVSEFITTSVRLPAAAGADARLRWRVGTDVGTFREGQYIDDVNVSDGYVCTCAAAQVNRVLFDFDGDAKTDLSIFRPSDDPEAPDFIVKRSSDGSLQATPWGSVGDLPANADLDGDRLTDLAVFRPASGTWYILRSSGQTFSAVTFGLAGDRPVPADHDGDGKADVAVYRPASGVWYSLNSGNGQFTARQFGLAGDVPVPGDHDGDGKADIAVYRPSTGVWYAARTSDSGYTIIPFGIPGDRPVAGDYDGDGRTDPAVFRPATGTWYMLRSKLGFGAAQFGLAGDAPLQADLDGDGMADIAVFRPATAVWYYIKSSDGSVAIEPFGLPGDTAVPSIYAGGQAAGGSQWTSSASRRE